MLAISATATVSLADDVWESNPGKGIHYMDIGDAVVLWDFRESMRDEGDGFKAISNCSHASSWNAGWIAIYKGIKPIRKI